MIYGVNHTRDMVGKNEKIPEMFNGPQIIRLEKNSAARISKQLLCNECNQSVTKKTYFVIHSFMTTFDLATFHCKKCIRFSMYSKHVHCGFRLLFPALVYMSAVFKKGNRKIIPQNTVGNK